MNRFQITEVRTEYQKNPLGLDEKQPRISWQMSSERENCTQSAYRIQVGSSERASDMWDSGVVASDCSTGVKYQGRELAPCTRYFITITIWNGNGEEAVFTDSWFETGLLDETVDAWEGAAWIGAPEKYVSADTIGVFTISSRFRIKEGGQAAGIVFGANDGRLMDARKNQYELSGENYIRYELEVKECPAVLKIYRVGYHPEDDLSIPLAVISADAVITEKNRYQEHELKVEVLGNCAYAYVDGVKLDEVEKETVFGKSMEPRQLNPLSFNDTTTFPRLCEIGYYAGANTEVHFDGLRVCNHRTPQAEIISLDREEGITLCGGREGMQQVKDPSAHSIPMFRRDISVKKEKKLASARLYITARGIYDCKINGRGVTDTWFNPGASQYDHHIMYQTYDVTSFLKPGINGIGITLASGWWCDSQTFVLRNYNYYGDKEAFLARLTVSYEDGSRENFVTDTENWEYYGEGPYTYAGFFQGEHLDGRRLHVYDEFSMPGYCLPEMKKPVVIEPVKIEAYSTMPPGFGRMWPKVDHCRTKIVGGVQAPVTEVCRVKAKSMTEPRKGLYIYDLGQEIAGVPLLRLTGEAGTQVTVRYGEMLYPKLPEYGNLHGLMLTENYRDAESIDKYILRGDAEGEIYCPRFTFHGYRYIEISGLTKAPALEDVESIQLSSVPKITGELVTSNPLLNRFIENVKWSQLCNFISIPTDCPQRNERMGWAGDTHVFCRTATYQSDTRLFYYRYLQALRDLQEENGQLPNIAPVGGGFGGITYESAMIIIVWELYQQYGDTEVIEEYFEAMKKWCSFIHGQGMPGQVFVGPLGDWLAPEETDNFLLWNAFYGYDMQLMHKMAKVIGKQADAEFFLGLEKEAKQYWNDTFVDEKTGKTKSAEGVINDTQCSYALPLAYHMFAEKYTKQAQEHLARKTKEVGYTVSTGFFGTGVLNSMLTEGGYTELAYRLIQQTSYPSWLYPVTQGATTIWERWNSYTVENGFGGNNSMNSFNHYSLGSVLSWMYETILGIRRDETAPGYHHFTLEPAMMGLESAAGGFETGYGRIESSWKKTEQGYVYECEIPCNTTATLRLMRKSGEIIERELGSGHYVFHTA